MMLFAGAISKQKETTDGLGINVSAASAKILGLSANVIVAISHFIFLSESVVYSPR